MGQVAVYSPVERRRQWSDAERLQILQEAFSPGAKVTHVARRYDVSTGLIYTWRRKHRSDQLASAAEGESPEGFAEAVLVNGGEPAPPVTPVIVIDLDRGRRVSIFATAPAALTTAALRALR